MLSLTVLAGFAATTAGPDVVPDAIDWPDIENAGFIAVAMTPAVIITGISVPITLRATVSTPLSPLRTLTLRRNGAPVLTASAGTYADITLSSGQTFQVELSNAVDLSIWTGTLSLLNLSDNAAPLAACSFTLQDTGSGGGGGGGGGGGEGGGDQP